MFHRHLQTSIYIINVIWHIGGSKGVPGARPQGSRFFRFDIQNVRNLTASGVHAPSNEVHAPPMGNPGSATVTGSIQNMIVYSRCVFNKCYQVSKYVEKVAFSSVYNHFQKSINEHSVSHNGKSERNSKISCVLNVLWWTSGQPVLTHGAVTQECGSLLPQNTVWF